MLLVAVGLLAGIVGLIWVMALSIIKADRSCDISPRAGKKMIAVKDGRLDEWAA